MGNVPRGRRGIRRSLTVLAVMVATILPMAAVAAQDDPREGLGSGVYDAESAISGLEHVGNFQKDAGTFNGFDSDLAFQGDAAFMGNYDGFQIFDVSDPVTPTLLTEVLCPGGQGDVSVFGDLMFRSVEGSNGRRDCGTEGNSGATAAQTRFRGVQVWNIADYSNPQLVANVQLCRGSHTHSVIEDPNDASTVYVYNSGTSSTTSVEGGPVCNNVAADGDNPARWKTEIIAIPVAAPETAAVVNEARLFTDAGTGAINGLQNQTDACHDITAFAAIGLAAGACEGNGILIDISDPVNPARIDAVDDDENFAYWHSASFNNDGTKVIFTDEWGGGGGARCRVTDPIEWGANAIFDLVETEDGLTMEFASYWKMPAVQTSQENCVAHNGSLVPVPGRDILVQAWYQGGITVLDFTDSANPVELAYFDRGPINPTSLVLGGFWSAYWYNGDIIGSEIHRGLDVFDLAETDMMSAAEIAAAKTVTFDETNVQGQDLIEWAPSTAVVGAFADQSDRAGELSSRARIRIDQAIADADAAVGNVKKGNAAKALDDIAAALAGDQFEDLRGALTDLADVLDPR